MPNNCIRALRHLMLAFVLSNAPYLPAFAADAPTPPPASTPQDPPAPAPQPPAAPGPRQAPAADATSPSVPDDFNPSESISEDATVPYPVDI
jgi:hypothetical protein